MLKVVYVNIHSWRQVYNYLYGVVVNGLYQQMLCLLACLQLLRVQIPMHSEYFCALFGTLVVYIHTTNVTYKCHYRVKEMPLWFNYRVNATTILYAYTP
jgi:hypothetical protein